MKKLNYALIFTVLVAAFVLAACGAAPTATAAPAATTAAPAATTAAPTATTAAPTPVATIASGLVQNNHLLMCSDIPYPPQEFFDENGDPQGVDIEIGQEIANRLGLKFQVVNSVFDTIIAAVTSGKCDFIISAMNITKDRQVQVSMIPYFEAGQSFVVVKGNPEKISVPTDLCGKAVAVESGTTEASYLQGTDDYAGKGLAQECTKDGKAAPNVVITQKDTDALQQLQSGKVVAYSTDSPVAGYYVVQHPDLFEVAGQVVEPIAEGIAVPCGAADCTSAPLSPVGQAIQTAFQSMVTDGTYAKILDKWQLSTGAISK
jgi:ABC-type amino acid transport/signal transduction systems, periplasmic component/domain